MYNYYEILGLENFDHNNEHIEKATQKKLQYNINNILDKKILMNEVKLLESAYKTLIDPKKRCKYDSALVDFLREVELKKENCNKKYSSNNRRYKNIAITSIVVASIIAIAGVAVKLKKRILPEDAFVGKYITMDSKFSTFGFDDDFAILEFPNYEEELSKKTIKNIEKCINEQIPFGFNIITNAKSEDEVYAEVYRFNSLVANYKFSYPVSIEFNLEDSYSDQELINLISKFNNKFIELDYLVEFSLSNNRYEKIKDRLDDNIRIRIRTDNKKCNYEDGNSLVFNDSALGIFLGNTESNGLFKNTIYTKEKYPYFVAENNLNNHEGKESIIGIDVSSFSGDIDWKTAKEEIDFAILRLCDFKNYHNDDNLKFKNIIDEKFERNLSMCETLDIPYGMYIYTRAKNKEEATTEANLIINYLKSKGISYTEYPIYIDIESYNNKRVDNMLSNGDKKLVEIANAFCTTLKKSGLNPGIYMNENDRARFVGINGGEKLLEENQFLYARYNSEPFSFSAHINAYDNIENYDIPDKPDTAGAIQFNNNATVNGINSGVDAILIKKY